MNKSNDTTFGIAFLILAIGGAFASFFAPVRPDPLYIGGILASVITTQLVLLGAKFSQPRPVNWLTVDVLFSASFSVIHFAYFAYWITGILEGTTEIWYLRNANVPEEVCRCLAMYFSCLNLFLAGYYLLPSRRHRPLINERPIPVNLGVQWGRFGRALIRVSFGCFFAFVAIVGPARFFGVYSGTNNISFVANIFFQLGQVFAVAGMTVASVSRQRFFAAVRRPNRMGIGKLDTLLILSTIAAIGLHGDRSTLVYLLIAFLVTRSEYFKPFPLKQLVLIGLALVSLLGFIVVFRSGQGSTYVYNPIDNINSALVNLGTSSVCGFVAADYVPDQHDYYFGQMQLLHIAGIIPFGRRLFGMTDSIENSSSMLLTKLIQGKVGAGVAGTGTSLFADFYFDFGFWGTACLFLIAGVFSKYIQNRARESTSLLWQVALVSNVTFLALCSRYTLIGGLIRFVLYAVIYTYVISIVYNAPLRIPMRRRRPGPRMVQNAPTGNA